ncbi:MAG: AsmA-like C-terminal region-containing protein [Bacteroidales bacterium]
MFSFYSRHRQQINSFLRVSFISGLIFVFVIVLILAILTYAYQDRIKKGFVDHINRGITTEIFVDDINVDLFRHFPQVSITFTNILVKETHPDELRFQNVEKDTLLSARKSYFRFGILDFLMKKYTVRNIGIRDASMHVKLFDQNSNNFSFWKSDKSASSSGDFSFEIQSFNLENLHFRFSDLVNRHYIEASLAKTHLKGNFASNDFRMKIKGDSQLLALTLDDVQMLHDHLFTYDFGFDVKNNNAFTFTKGLFSIDDLDFFAEGLVDVSSNNVFLDLNISGNDLQIERLFSALPANYAKHFVNYKSNGFLEFDAIIQGCYSSSSNPSISADFGIRSGKVTNQNNKLELEELALRGSFQNGKKRNLYTSEITLEEFSTTIQQGLLKGKGSMRNFHLPHVDLTIHSDINPSAWILLLNLNSVEQAKGQLLIDIDYSGTIPFRSKDIADNVLKGQLTGTLNGQNIGFLLTGSPVEYEDLFCDVSFNGDNIAVHNFSGRASSSDFMMQGSFSNFFPWLFLENEKLFANARLKSNNLNFNELLKEESSSGDTTHHLSLPKKLSFDLNADIAHLHFRKFKASNVEGDLSLNDQVFYADEISMNTMQGKIEANGYINGKNEHYLVMGSNAKITNVDVRELFYQMGNFGQSSIVDENLKGRIFADASFVANWSPSLQIDWNTLETTAAVKVEEGELINYRPMLALSRFIRVSDLNQVRFSTLENQLYIRNQTLFIPDMEINSNAMNISISGEHQFDNTINYRLQVLLSELLAKENKRNRNPQEEYGQIIDDGLGRTTLFLRVTGNIDEPVFSYDTRAVKEKISEDFQQERKNLGRTLRQEFGSPKADTLPDGTLINPTKRQQEEKEIREREKGKFIIEWD